jgi:hypothetical protein
MREENLDLDATRTSEINPLYPFPMPSMHKSRKRDFAYEVFSDGDMYCIAYDKYCRDQILVDGYLHMPLIIIGQLDKTFIDSKGKLTLESLKISLHIFKEQVRRDDFAWRPLGYISNQANLPKYKNSEDKASDYHTIIHYILHSMKRYQEKYEVFLWDMRIGKSMIHIAFHPVFGYMIGDNEGHDKSCGKFLNRMNVQRLCRYCDTPMEQSDNPFYTDWRYTLGTTIARLVSEQRSDQLRNMSYHCIKNGFSGIKFADPDRGINGATPAERLHLLNHGIFQMILLEYNFGQKRAKTTSRTVAAMFSSNSTTDNIDEDQLEEVTEDDVDAEESIESDLPTEYVEDTTGTDLPPQPNLSKKSMFTQAVCDQFDYHAKQYGRILQKQSCRYWNRSFFYNGITSNSKKVGQEERNCLLLCLIIYTLANYEYYSSILDPEKPTKKKKNKANPCTPTIPED